MAAGRSTVTRFLKLATEDLPGALKGSNVDDLKCLKRRVEQIWEHMTRDADGGGGRATPLPAPTPVIVAPASESVSTVESSGAQAAIDRRTAALLREIQQFDEASSRTESFWKGKWLIIIVGSVIVIIGGVCAWRWFRRRGRGGVHGHGVEDAPPPPPPAVALPEADAPALPPQELSSDPTAAPSDPIAAADDRPPQTPGQAPCAELLLLNPCADLRCNKKCQELIDALNRLYSDPKNAVFLVSGQQKGKLAGWFEQCEGLGVAAKHGYFIWWNKNSQWESANLATDSDWKSIANPMMQQYTDATQGSYIEDRKTVLVWHYEEADVNFGLTQSKALKDHLQGMLSDHPVYVKSGHKIVKVIPQGMSKGVTVQKLIGTMVTRGTIPYFILCVGDDRSDKEIFKAVTSPKSNSADTAEIFACTIGFKPSLSKYFVEGPSDVLNMLEGLTNPSTSDVKDLQRQGMSKRVTVQKLIGTMATRGTIPDFILCVGDDRSDEDMFKAITSPKSNSADTAEIFACTIGFKPSSAEYFLEGPSDVLKILEGLTNPSVSDFEDLQDQVSEDSQE